MFSDYPYPPRPALKQTLEFDLFKKKKIVLNLNIPNRSLPLIPSSPSPSLSIQKIKQKKENRKRC
jgi:hypothetical protein